MSGPAVKVEVGANQTACYVVSKVWFPCLVRPGRVPDSQHSDAPNVW